MNAQNLINSAVLTLIEDELGEDWKVHYFWNDAWDHGEAEEWLRKIANGALLSIRIYNDKINPVLV